MSPYIRVIYRLNARADTPLRARRIVDRELSGLVSEKALEDIKLLVSELVTNGIRHGTEENDGVITLEMLLDGKIRCTVGDHGRQFARASAEPVPEGGWGLKLVEQLACRWGLSHSREGTQVWFEPPEKPNFDRRETDTGQPAQRR